MLINLYVPVTLYIIDLTQPSRTEVLSTPDFGLPPSQPPWWKGHTSRPRPPAHATRDPPRNESRTRLRTV